MEHDRNYIRAVKYAQKSNIHKWVSALAASRVSSLSALAQDTGNDRSTVEGWAAAGELYREIRKYPTATPNFSTMASVAKSLGVSKFGIVSEKRKQYGLGLEDVLDYLVTAAENGTSARQLRGIIDDQHGDSLPEWEKRVKRIVSLCRKVENDYGVPEDIREYVRDVAEVLEKW